MTKSYNPGDRVSRNGVNGTVVSVSPSSYYKYLVDFDDGTRAWVPGRFLDAPVETKKEG